MDIKTASQIAEDVTPFDGGRPTERAPLTWEEIVAVATAAVEADRAQRNGRLAKVTVRSAELSDPALRCDDCGDELCTVEEADVIVTLADVALTHGGTVCEPRAMCDNCDERIEPDDVHAGDGMCGSCNHNAARSGA
ncbi:hypothetical protein ACFWHR_07765 [Leucobacter sp. NPDC058333]|uniref:hypothetical protein n=1 Tax=Leucobacter sp. NPDC058333 TaxID=3346450 RepID=UPI0036558E01